MSVEADTFSDMIISCESCAVRDIGCGDCILTFFVNKVDNRVANRLNSSVDSKAATENETQAIAIEIPDSTAEAIDLLSSRGIIRPLRYNSA